MTAIAEFHSCIDAAEILELTPGRIRQICRWSDGKIGRKIGRDWFLTDADLEIIRLTILRKSKKSQEYA